ncbi:hypothetical protein FGK63_20345 [Ruegeria sediminis]|uniref:Uncharacterized protein n=1 Tax=Ruegeria sediminis TaxID=2583820 RepID=A0ABY2WS13_9RHOB|nr:hypothetical protein [Ruegeria sediminis]TMV02580.1 hypothetical protein FGK63_20345 [Ruegeria sediminis]
MMLEQDRKKMDELVEQYKMALALEDNPSPYMHPDARDALTAIVHYICERRLGFGGVEAYFSETGEVSYPQKIGR